MLRFLIVITLLFGTLAVADHAIYQPQPMSLKNNCVLITMDICKGLAYNDSIYPNLLNHQNQEEAEEAIKQFNPLIKVKCSEDIKLFLCSVYAPFCNTLKRPIPPCRHLCKSAMNGCESLMVRFGFRWPEQLNCSTFPDEGICFGENKTSTNAPPVGHHSKNITECPLLLKPTLHGASPFLQLETSIVPDCSFPCEADHIAPVFFPPRTRRWLRLLTGVFAVLCFFASVFTIITFFVDLARFIYPVRPILYMSFCYLGLSVVYMIGVVADTGFACAKSAHDRPALVIQGVESFPCSALAVAHYFFSIASSVWWVVLCLAWFLTATHNWGHEFIESLWLYFHAFAWGVPAVLAVAMLITNAFDGDLFTGICSVGNLNSKALFWFVVVPVVTTLVIGAFFLIMGIFSMVGIRKYFKLQQSDAEKLSKIENQMCRITMFSVIYVVATLIFAGIMLYQAHKMPSWIELWFSQRCHHSNRDQFEFKTPLSDCPPLPKGEISQPEFLLFFMKYMLQLLLGITCAIWVMSNKTIASYQTCWARVVRGRTSVATAEDAMPMRVMIPGGLPPRGPRPTMIPAKR